MTVRHGREEDGYRRRVYRMIGAAVAGRAAGTGAEAGSIQEAPSGPGLPLRLTEFEPKSMLHVAETQCARARFPVIDFHSHISWRPRASKPATPPSELLKTMDAVNLHTMVNLTGGSGEQLASAIATFDKAFPAPIRVDDRTDVDARQRARLRGVAGRRSRQGENGWRRRA